MNSSKTVINTFDFSVLEDLDPILQDGHKIIFKKEIPTEIKRGESKIMENINYRIILIGEEFAPQNVRIELTSENDIFFYFLCELDIFSYKKLQESQKFQCNFGEFIPTIKKLFTVSYDTSEKKANDNIILKHINTSSSGFIGGEAKQSNINYTFITGTFGQQTKIYRSTLSNDEGKSKEDNYKLVLNLISEEEVNLEFVKLLGHKEVSVLKIDFFPISEDFIKRVITYKFNYTRSKLVVYQERVNYMTDLIKSKNPYLADEITKIPARLTKEFIQTKTKLI